MKKVVQSGDTTSPKCSPAAHFSHSHFLNFGGFKLLSNVTAFSLVEMLMALLVASLLMVALAPVITKKFSENLSISSIGGTRADYKRTWYYDPAKEYHEWSVPNGVNVIKVTAIGGGGAGGGSSFGSREFTTDTTWNIPEGVEKIRVFMTGGGGAGASGGAGAGTAKYEMPTISTGQAALNSYDDYKTEGETTVTLRSIAKVPRNSLCASTSNNPWKLKKISSSNATAQMPEQIYDLTIPQPTDSAPQYLFKVTACGSGGGGGGNLYVNTTHIAGGGGAGGYVTNIPVLSNTGTVYVKISGGGGGGGDQAHTSQLNGQNGGAYSGGGGAGGSSTTYTGGAGGTDKKASPTTYGGKGGPANSIITNDGVASRGGANGQVGATLSNGGGGCTTSNSTDVYRRGGKGGNGTLYGGGGGGGAPYNVQNSYGEYGGGGGGGGGGPTSITTKTGTLGTLIFQIGGGGGGGSVWNYAGGGGGGGGYGGGGGGGAGLYTTGGGNIHKGENGIGGTGGTKSTAADWAKIGNQVWGGDGYNGRDPKNYYSTGCYTSETSLLTSGEPWCSAGGGAGWNINAATEPYINGKGQAQNSRLNTAGIIQNTVWNDTNLCNGGSGSRYSGSSYLAAEQGKKGALRMYYGGMTIECDYTQTSNGSGGGGAGQVWFGELTVTAGSKITMTVGEGGEASSEYGHDGNPGTASSIGSLVSVEGGRGGTYQEDDANIALTAGEGKGYKSTSLKNWTSYISDTDFAALKSKMGQNGNPGTLVADGGDGGNGGYTIDRFGHDVKGGNGGGVGGNGKPGEDYGSGGGGGGGVATAGGTPGLGGKGAPGYIYVEWGDTNGGGGASGQVITQESIWVTPGTIVKIYPGAGGTAKALKELTSTDGASTVSEGYKGEDGPDGGDTYLIVKDASAEKKVGVAKGGKGGIAGGKDHGRGGGIKTDASGNYDPNNIQPEIENTTPGETATDENGGMGGTLTETMCPLLTELKKVGLGGCGGNTSTAGACQNAVLVTGEGVNAGGIGNGGGGGAVTNTAGVKTPYKGGNGSGGMVTIEWSN